MALRLDPALIFVAGASQRHDEDRKGARPVQQVFDEIEQRGIGPLQILEDHDHRVACGEPLEEEPPAREQVGLVGRGVLLEPEEMRKPGLDERAVGRVGDRALDYGAKLVPRRRPVLAFEDVRPSTHHLGKRPVGDPLAVREAATAVPAERPLETVHVFEEFPAQAGLADPRDPGHLHEVRLAVVGTGEKDILDQLELTVAADEGGLEALRLHQPADAGDHPPDLPQPHRLGLSFELVQAGIPVLDRRIRCSLGRIANKDRARRRGGLHARRRIHEVTRDHPLSGRAEVDGRLAGEDSGSSTQFRGTQLDAELRHCVDDLERGADRPFRVVLLRHRRPPDRHHRVADELLDDPAVASDHRLAGTEVPGEQIANLL